MKKIIAFVLSVAMLLACLGAFAEAAMTPAEFAEAQVDDPVVVEAYVQCAAYNAAYGNVSLFLADETGAAYYVYRAACDDALAAQLTDGIKVKATGFKGEWSGEVEIVDPTVEVLEGTYIAPAVDVTAELGTDALIEKMNALVAVNGAVVVAYNEAGDAFSYAWDGSGQAGANSDLYFTVKVGEADYTFTVESDEVPEGSDAYTAVTELKVGDTVDLEGFLYWYNGAQLHVNAVTVK